MIAGITTNLHGAQLGYIPNNKPESGREDSNSNTDLSNERVSREKFVNEILPTRSAEEYENPSSDLPHFLRMVDRFYKPFPDLMRNLDIFHQMQESRNRENDASSRSNTREETKVNNIDIQPRNLSCQSSKVEDGDISSPNTREETDANIGNVPSHNLSSKTNQDYVELQPVTNINRNSPTQSPNLSKVPWQDTKRDTITSPAITIDQSGDSEKRVGSLQSSDYLPGVTTSSSSNHRRGRGLEINTAILPEV
ncbi:MAG: hypothetical protein ACPHOK_07595, partial [Akkermansiaceae bacterium]